MSQRPFLPPPSFASPVSFNLSQLDGNTVGYMYLANSPLVSQITYQHSGTTRMTTTKAYDDLNRLTLISSQPSGSGVPPVSFNIHFIYDAKGRRIQKTVTNGIAIVTTNFVYDGWNLIGILAPNSSLRASFLWGTDLSGSPQGAGGVGGLLELSCFGSSQTNSFVAYDGNGNVASLINAASGIAVANYEYGPFGEVIRQTGPMAKLNPIRFSTKYDDDESDLLYYGYRYYKPSTGTWLNRDPLSEISFFTAYAKQKQGKNLKQLIDEANAPHYVFVHNDPESKEDSLGTYSYSWGPTPCQGVGVIDGFIQVGLGGGTIPPANHQFVDDGSHGFGSAKPNCPPLVPSSENNLFMDSPGVGLGLLGIPIGTHGMNGLKFEVCHVCLKQCCNGPSKKAPNQRVPTPGYTGYSIVKTGPCMTYTITEGDGLLFLNSPGVGTSSVGPSVDFSQVMNSAFPGVLDGGCIACKNPN